MKKRKKSFVLHDETVNTKGFRMLTSGADLSEFQRNPVMFYLHDEWGQLPIGRWENIRVEGTQILADPVFDMEDEFARRVAGKVERDFLRMASIGSWPPEALSDDPMLVLDGQKLPTVTKWKVREASIVPIGSNHNALRFYDHEGHLIDDFDEIIKLADFTPTQTNSQANMKELLKFFGLADNASESDALAKARAIQTEVETLKAEKQALADQLKTLNEAEKARKDAEAIALVDGAIADGRLQADSKEKMIALFDKDHESAKAVLGAMPKRQSIAAQVREGAQGKDQPEGRENWTFMDWAKKDPKGLEKMRVSDSKGYQALRESYGSGS